jgi:hypothetical protein
LTINRPTARPLFFWKISPSHSLSGLAPAAPEPSTPNPPRTGLAWHRLSGWSIPGLLIKQTLMIAHTSREGCQGYRQFEVHTDPARQAHEPSSVGRLRRPSTTIPALCPNSRPNRTCSATACLLDTLLPVGASTGPCGCGVVVLKDRKRESGPNPGEPAHRARLTGSASLVCAIPGPGVASFPGAPNPGRSGICGASDLQAALAPRPNCSFRRDLRDPGGVGAPLGRRMKR